MLIRWSQFKTKADAADMNGNIAILGMYAIVASFLASIM